MHENGRGIAIVNGGVHLHQGFGRGLLETVYEMTLKDGITRTIHGEL